ncbi:MAG: response regulator transcription factor [Cyanobacteria bacterium J069]|nr:MAG: DNA-binding response regulator [Cyanobacteria bacterium J069]
MTQVLVAAKSAVARAGLTALLTEAGLEVVASVGFNDLANSQDLANQLAALRPEVLLLFGESTEEPALLLADLLTESATLPPVAIALLVEDPSPEWVAEALRLGVRGVLPTTAIASEIVAAVTAAAAGLVPLHPETLEALLPALPAIAPALPPLPLETALTPREAEVLTMLAEGLSNKAIAQRLHLSEHTVKFHISSLFAKLQVSSRTEAVTLGARRGLILL